MSSEQPELLFQKWASKFGSYLWVISTSSLIGTAGDIIYIHLLGQPMIILSSEETVRDLMDKRSSIYSDRPRFVLSSELFVALDIHHRLS
jgi:hypothetical protein